VRETVGASTGRQGLRTLNSFRCSNHIMLRKASMIAWYFSCLMSSYLLGVISIRIGIANRR
jgi:hypothetical protein